MRTRSSRFFVILLHLVGVCHQPTGLRFLLFASNSNNPSSGIVAVHPHQVQLSTFQLCSYSTTTDGAADSTTKIYSEDQQLEPIWLQDQDDLLCLGPTGAFTECGDATLWFVQRQALPEGRKNRMLLSGLFAGEQPPSQRHHTEASAHRKPVAGWTFQIVDVDVDAQEEPEAEQLPSNRRRRRRDRRRSFECLDRRLVGRETSSASSSSLSTTVVQVNTCRRRWWRHHRLPLSAVWLIDSETGILQSYEDEPSVQSRQWNRRKGTAASTRTDAEAPAAAPWCLFRSTTTKEAVLASCHDNHHHNTDDVRMISTSATATSTAAATTNTTNHTDIASQRLRPVRFSFVRYRAVPATTGDTATLSHAPPQQQHNDKPVDDTVCTVQMASTAHRATESLSSSSSSLSATTTTNTQYHHHHHHHALPSTRDKAHAQASAEPHPELKLSAHVVFSNKPKRTERLPFSVLRDTNPILLAGQQRTYRSDHHKASTCTTTTALDHSLSPQPQQQLHHHPTGSHHTIPSTTKLLTPHARIRRHPYIEQATNEIWTDPQTGLQYATDLCHYLGNNRHQHGRHSLMGVGQYRKGYVIKVYGIAFYVSKRDVLAAANTFGPYATMSAEELRTHTQFYHDLRRPDLPVRRTILLQTNMQLSAETMTRSLQSEWDLLTDEAKATLVGASLAPRQADEEMLSIINSPENPSRCSCSQTAPVEYNADPNCCARGTELSFTWLKNGDLELRLNRRVMEVFQRPDIAEGIFYEYLRVDDPMSPELLERVVDGFPFLLAPLAQVEGVKLGQQSHAKEHSEEDSNPILRAIVGFADAVSSQAGEVASMMQRGAAEAATHAGNAARALGDAAQNSARSLSDAAQPFGREIVFHPLNAVQSLGESTQHFVRDMVHRRQEALKESTSFPDAVLTIFSPNRRALQSVTEWVERNITPSAEMEELARNVPYGRVFGYPLSRWFGDTNYQAPDEIGPMKRHPTMSATRKAFLALVHLYLLLLFIVSFPGSYSTRTKFIIRRSMSRESSFASGASSLMEEEIKLRSLDDGSDCARSSKGRLLYQEQQFSGGLLLSRARRVLRPTVPEDNNVPEEVHLKKPSDAAGSPLKKKSFSYFL